MNHRDAAILAATVVREVRAGRARADVARDHGIAKSIVTRICHRAGLPHAVSLTDRQRALAAVRTQTAQMAAEKISQGDKIKDIAEILNLRTEYIYKALRENGLSLRAIQNANGPYA